jgi:hypothetical protein
MAEAAAEAALPLVAVAETAVMGISIFCGCAGRAAREALGVHNEGTWPRMVTMAESSFPCRFGGQSRMKLV